MLHWFKWEAYLTWVTGFGLLIVQYYVHAEAYLIDPRVMPHRRRGRRSRSRSRSLAAGWFIYDGAVPHARSASDRCCWRCGVRADPDRVACSTRKVFSGRGAFIHVGALVGTIMAANVFVVIIPDQKKMIAGKMAGREPDPRRARAASSARSTTTT